MLYSIYPRPWRTSWATPEPLHLPAVYSFRLIFPYTAELRVIRQTGDFTGHSLSSQLLKPQNISWALVTVMNTEISDMPPAFQKLTMSLEMSQSGQIQQGNIRAVTEGWRGQFPHVACESKGLVGHISNHGGPVTLVPWEHQSPTRHLTVNSSPSRERLFILTLHFLFPSQLVPYCH